MEYVKLSNILGEAAHKLEEASELLKQNGLDGYAIGIDQISSLFLQDAIGEDLTRVKGARLLWQEAPIVGSTRCVEGRRYHTWKAAMEAAATAGGKWRLPTPEEVGKLHAEDPECIVFQPNGRYGSRKPGKADGIGSTVALWTIQEDSRDFAIECTLTEEFGLTSHPAFKNNYITAWLVEEL